MEMCKGNPVCDQVQTSHSNQHTAYPVPPAPVRHTRADPDWSISCKAVTRKQELLAGIVISCQDAVEGIGATIICSTVLSFCYKQDFDFKGLLALRNKNILLGRSC